MSLMSTRLSGTPVTRVTNVVLWTGSIGYILSFTVTFVLFCQVLKQYITIFHKSETLKKKKTKLPYILVMVYMTSTFIQSILYLTLSTNVFTAHNLEFTHLRCAFGYWINTGFIGLNYMILCIIFLYRLHTTYKESAFHYNAWVYRSFLMAICIILPIFYILMNAPQITTTTFEIEYDPLTRVAMCTSSVTGTVMTITIVVLILLGVTVPSISIGLLILFIKGLWSLNRQMIESFVEHYSNNSIQDASQGQTQPSKSTVTVDIVLESWQRQATITREQLKSEVQRIVRLHNLMKKQTILVFVAMCSTILFFVGNVVSKYLYREAGWDIVVNSICVWMMLDTSKMYWNFCKTWGLCACCYRKTNVVGM